MKPNLLTMRLLELGYTKEQTPPGCRPWNDFYGGWEYDSKRREELVFETPCGLLAKGSDVQSVGFGKVDWCAENDNPVILCPRFQPDCKLRDKRCPIHGSRETYVYCACKRTYKRYMHEKSVKAAHDELCKRADEEFKTFAASKNNRVCKSHCFYNRAERKWYAGYYPKDICPSMNCTYCVVLQKEISKAKGNVFYDVKTTWTEPAYGLFPEEEHITLQKGIKLFDRQVPLTICEAIAKYGKRDIIWRYRINHSREVFINPTMKFELINFRAARVDKRDLLQDLQDAAEGIKVVHAADETKAAAEQKRQKRELAKQKKIERIEKLILEKGSDNLDSCQFRRAEKALGLERIEELDEQRKNARSEEPIQITLMEEW